MLAAAGPVLQPQCTHLLELLLVDSTVMPSAAAEAARQRPTRPHPTSPSTLPGRSWPTGSPTSLSWKAWLHTHTHVQVQGCVCVCVCVVDTSGCAREAAV